MTQHRHGCTEPGWALAKATRPRGWLIARCHGCDAVELRREALPSADPMDEAEPSAIPWKGTTAPGVESHRPDDGRRMAHPFRGPGEAVNRDDAGLAAQVLRGGAA